MTTKCVKLCRNGDSFFPPVNVVVNPREIRNMDAFLDEVTKATRMGNAARKVCTPKKGHKIEDLAKLISGETYVAVGREAFKTLEYGNIRIHRPVNVQHREIRIEPVKHSKILMSARCRKVALWESSGLKTIFVYRNGDDKQPSHRILLDRRTLLNMDKVLELVTERVRLESGAVFALYTMLGKEVYSTADLVSGEKYVAVGHGKRFKRTAYNDNQKISPNNSPRRAKMKQKFLENKKSFVLPSATEEKHKETTSEERNGKNEVRGKALNTQKTITTLPTAQLVQNTKARTEEIKDDRKANPLENIPKTKNKSVNERLKGDKKDVERPVENLPKTKSKIPSDRLKDDHSHESVFKASGAASEKAKQVEDDKEVKVEKPIDQVPAEEVMEETIDQNPSSSNEQSDETHDEPSPTSGGTETNQDTTTEAEEEQNS